MKALSHCHYEAVLTNSCAVHDRTLNAAKAKLCRGNEKEVCLKNIFPDGTFLNKKATSQQFFPYVYTVEK